MNHRTSVEGYILSRVKMSFTSEDTHGREVVPHRGEPQVLVYTGSEIKQAFAMFG